MMRMTAVVCALAVGSVPTADARAKSKRICVDVKIKSYRSLKRPSKRPAPRAAAGKPVRSRSVARPLSPRPRARTAQPLAPRTQPLGRRAQPVAGGVARPVRATPRPRAKVWVNPFGGRYHQGYRSGYKKASRKWRAYLRRRLGQRAGRSRGYPYPPAAYLRRLVEHYVTHARGFIAVRRRCAERITIEMYPIKGGWTVFARNSQRAREEKVDQVEYSELPRLAERVVKALLEGRNIAATANLRTILKADSLRQYRTIKGSHHFTFTLGTAFKIGKLPTFDSGAVGSEVRALAPLTFSIGYRGRFNAWGLDAFMRGGVGLQRESALRNTDGGHVDLDGLWGIGLHFLRYHSPHGMMSFYYGAGALFDLTVFTAIKPVSERHEKDRDRLTGGGLNLELVIGVEFMRASPAQFFLQAVISAPVYPFEMGTELTRIKAYIPEMSATVGIMF